MSIHWPENQPPEETLRRLAHLVSLVPYFGGTLSTLIFEIQSKKALERLQELMEEFARRLKLLEEEGRNPAGLAASDEFQALFLRTMAAVASEPAIEKRQALHACLWARDT
jgi:hypothetical protein